MQTETRRYRITETNETEGAWLMATDGTGEVICVAYDAELTRLAGALGLRLEDRRQIIKCVGRRVGAFVDFAADRDRLDREE